MGYIVFIGKKKIFRDGFSCVLLVVKIFFSYGMSVLVLKGIVWRFIRVFINGYFCIIQIYLYRI